MRIGLLGDGSWATAIAKIITDNNNELLWWIRGQDRIVHIKSFGNNPDYLSSIDFTYRPIVYTTDIINVISNSDLIFIVIPSVYIDKALLKTKGRWEGKKVISAVKGMIPSHDILPSIYLNKNFGISLKELAVISGPSHAEEVAMERISYLTLASKNKILLNNLSKALKNDNIKISYSNDVIGCEWAGVLKNIYAIAAGIACGLGYGDNFLAVLISNSIREMEKFIEKVSPIVRNINNSAYLGDLLVTGYSPFSRNRTFGKMIGKGYTIRSTQMEMKMLAEGFFAIKGIYKEMKKRNIKLPIITAVYNILYKEVQAKEEFINLCYQMN